MPRIPQRHEFFYDEHYKEPFPAAREKLFVCTQSLRDSRCGYQIYDHIFMFSALSEDCCEAMVDNGRECNNYINIAVAAIPRFKKYKNRLSDLTGRLFDECKERIENF